MKMNFRGEADKQNVPDGDTGSSSLAGREDSLDSARPGKLLTDCQANHQTQRQGPEAAKAEGENGSSIYARHGPGSGGRATRRLIDSGLMCLV